MDTLCEGGTPDTHIAVSYTHLAAYLSEAGEAFAGGGVIERFVRWFAAGVAGVQLYPVVQNVRCIGKAQGSSGICAVSLCLSLIHISPVCASAATSPTVWSVTW